MYVCVGVSIGVFSVFCLIMFVEVLPSVFMLYCLTFVEILLRLLTVVLCCLSDLLQWLCHSGTVIQSTHAS